MSANCLTAPVGIGQVTSLEKVHALEVAHSSKQAGAVGDVRVVVANSQPSAFSTMDRGGGAVQYARSHLPEG